MNRKPKTACLLLISCTIASGRLTTTAFTHPQLSSSLRPGSSPRLSPPQRPFVLARERPQAQLRASAEYSDDMVPTLYASRWVQLIYLSLLALLSDWVCFSVAATPGVFQTQYNHNPAQLLDIFLFTNVFSCFFVTDLVARIGLGKAVKGAAVLMTAGCLIRSGVPILGTGLPDWETCVAGTVLVGAAQPIFQCTPPLLSATWFGPDERATSTAVALNFNQIGIATAFLVGGAMCDGPQGLNNYFGVITIFSDIVAAGTLLQFKDKPPIPPSNSELEKLRKGEAEPPFLESAKKLLSAGSFRLPLAAFVCSISITNIVGAFIDEVLERGGVTDQLAIDIAGASFEFAILLGGIFIGSAVDKSKKYKFATMACLAATFLLLIPLGLTEHAIGNEPRLLLLALFGLGMTAGPIQPINAELAVEVSYPCDETAVESTQQIFGNLVSALLIPLAEYMSREVDITLLPGGALESDMRGDVLLLCVLTALTYAAFTSFNSPLRRSLMECEGEDECLAADFNDLPNFGEADPPPPDKVAKDSLPSPLPPT